MRRLTSLVLLASTLLGAGCDDLIGPMKIELPMMCGVTYAGPECGFLSPQALDPAPLPGIAEQHPFIAQAWNECTEEWVDFAGTAHRVSLAQTNGNAFALKIKDDWTATGIGRTSGTNYQGTVTQLETFVLAAGWVDTRRLSIRFTSQGSEADFIYSVLTHTTISPTGDITSSFEEPTLRCK
jgi:hypothetical protein